MTQRAMVMSLLVVTLAVVAWQPLGADGRLPRESGTLQGTPTPPTVDSPLTALPTRLPAVSYDVQFPAVAGMSGQVYLMQYGRWLTEDGQRGPDQAILQADFNDKPAEVLAVASSSRTGPVLSPDGTAFGLAVDIREAPYHLAVVADATTFTGGGELSAGGNLVVWSPTSRVLLASSSEDTILIDRDERAWLILDLPAAADGLVLQEAAWTTANDLLLGWHDSRNGRLRTVWLVDELELEVLADDSDGSQGWHSLLDVPLEGYTLGAGYRFGNRAQIFADGRTVRIPTPPDRTATGLCDKWTVYYGPQPALDPVLVIPSTHLLAAGPQLPDGSVIVVRYYKPTCSISENVMVELWQVGADGSSRVIVEAFALSQTTVPAFVETRPFYTLSPDGRYLLWVEPQPITDTTFYALYGFSALYIKDLQADVVRPLALTTDVLSVVWVGE